MEIRPVRPDEMEAARLLQAANGWAERDTDRSQVAMERAGERAGA